MVMNYLIILLAILVPFIGAFIVWAISKISEDLGGAFTVLFSAVTLSLIAWAYFLFSQGKELTFKLDILMPVSFQLTPDALGLFLSLITSIVWVLASLYSIEYVNARRTLFNVFLLFSLYGMIGIAFAANLMTLLIFFEFFSVASAELVIHEGTPEAIRAGFQYLFISIVGSVMMIFATAAVYKITGSMDLIGTGLRGLNSLSGHPFLPALFWLLIAGFAIKAGMFPVHVWLPEAHPIAPSSASALLSGVMIKAGAYGIIRVVYGVFGTSLINTDSMGKALLVLAVITMIVGSLIAMVQVELKRMLAYSSVAQIGYVILGIALATPLGLAGGVLHIFNHALMKGTLFLAAGAIIHQTGLRRLEDLKGIGRSMPLTMTAITLAGLSMIGVPPLVGFFSKWLLALGALQAKGSGLIAPWAAYTIVASLILSSLMNLAYYGPIIIDGWFRKPGEEEVQVAEAAHGHGATHEEVEEEPVRRADPSWIMGAPVIVLAVSTFIFGVYIDLPMKLVNGVVKLYF